MANQTTPSPSREELEVAYGDVLDALELLEQRTAARVAAETKAAAAKEELGAAQAFEFQARTDAQTAAANLNKTMDRLFVLPAAGFT